MVQEVVIASAGKRGAFQTDDTGDFLLIPCGHAERYRTAHRAAHDDGSLNAERQPEIVD